MKSSPIDAELESVLLALREAMTARLVREAKARDYSLAQCEAMKYIHHGEAVTMKDLAAKLKITPPSTSALVDALEARDIVRRDADPTDRRIVRIALSPKGQREMVEIHHRVADIFTDMLHALDGEDKRELIRILKKCA